MICLVIAFPRMVDAGLTKEVKVDPNSVVIESPDYNY